MICVFTFSIDWIPQGLSSLQKRCSLVKFCQKCTTTHLARLKIGRFGSHHCQRLSSWESWKTFLLIKKGEKRPILNFGPGLQWLLWLLIVSVRISGSFFGQIFRPFCFAETEWLDLTASVPVFGEEKVGQSDGSKNFEPGQAFVSFNHLFGPSKLLILSSCPFYSWLRPPKVPFLCFFQL